MSLPENFEKVLRLTASALVRGACTKVEGMYTPPVGFSTEKAEEVLRLLQDLLHK